MPSSRTASTTPARMMSRPTLAPSDFGEKGAQGRNQRTPIVRCCGVWAARRVVMGPLPKRRVIARARATSQ
eukprot:3554859-Alexandrium_andersonii.AAC.1